MLTQMNSYQKNKKLKILVENVSKEYDGSEILNDINLKIYEGEFVSILGPSGSGKSTIFNMITKITKNDSGRIVVDGNYSYMYQKDLLLPYKNIIDNVSLPLVLNGETKNIARNKVKSYFEIFGIAGYEYKYPYELSGGMRQRANFLRTYINSDDIMLLDEPFGSLDSITRNSMQKWLLNIKRNVNSTIVLITHDIDEAIMLSNRIYIISDKPSTVKEEFFIDRDIYNDKNLGNIAELRKKILCLL